MLGNRHNKPYNPYILRLYNKLRDKCLTDLSNFHFAQVKFRL